MSTAQLTPVGVSIQSVLIATDFSQCSDTALIFGLNLAKSYGAQAYVVSVVPASQFMLAGPSAYVAARDAAFRDLVGLKADLKRVYAYEEGKDYHLFLLEGNVAESILEFASRKCADLIVVGTHGRSGLGKALIGSVAEGVFRSSQVPVMTLGPNLRDSTPKRPPRNILVAADCTAASERAVEFAASLAREHSASLTAVHALHHLPADEAERARALQKIKTRLAELLHRKAEGVQCSLLTHEGQVVPTILQTACETEADLLVIGVRASTGLLDRLMFPHAYQIIRESPCPVLTLREGPRTENLN
jgi:nucleotide-binding universal stress UspA family protein